jgi:hypothetical protein
MWFLASSSPASPGDTKERAVMTNDRPTDATIITHGFLARLIPLGPLRSIVMCSALRCTRTTMSRA